MSIQAGTHSFGPDNANLVVRTYREGVAAKVGHDLIIEVQTWEATLRLGEAPVASSLELSADPRSLHVRDGLRGVKPLTDKDRRDIRKSIDEKVLGGDPIQFRSDDVAATDDGRRLAVTGELTMHGATRPARFELTVADDDHVEGLATLVQSEWGIKPYRGLMGALKVRDSLEVAFDGRPAAG